MDRLGFIITAIGVSLADSECLLVPLTIVAIGILIIWRASNAE